MDYDIAKKITIMPQRQVIAQFYNNASPIYSSLIQNAINASAFGGNSGPIYDHINDLNYLLALLIIIEDEMRRDLSKGLTRPWYEKRYYIDKYNLDCIRHYFDCALINITPMLSVIGLNNAEIPTGIGYMYIDGNPDDPQAEINSVS